MTPDSYREARANAKIVSETEWMRVYEMGKHLSYESTALAILTPCLSQASAHAIHVAQVQKFA